MSSKTGKRLVIDASVVQAAGGEGAADPTSQQCRDFLKAVYQICHHVVLTPDIDEEWKRHQSRFARKWRRWMHGRKKIFRFQPESSYTALSERVVRTAFADRDREAMEKDLCLIEAALATDRIVASRDNAVRQLFAQASASVKELKNLVWVNPAREEEHPLSWLEQGAPIERSRQLGFWMKE